MFGGSHLPSRAERLSPSWLCVPDVRKIPSNVETSERARKEMSQESPGKPEQQCSRGSGPATHRGPEEAPACARARTAAPDPVVLSGRPQRSRSRSHGRNCSGQRFSLSRTRVGADRGGGPSADEQRTEGCAARMGDRASGVKRRDLDEPRKLRR